MKPTGVPEVLLQHDACTLEGCQNGKCLLVKALEIACEALVDVRCTSTVPPFDLSPSDFDHSQILRNIRVAADALTRIRAMGGDKNG